MSGFSADWLALREPADRAARSRLLIAELVAHLDGRIPRVADLGCGTGATLRALGQYLPDATEWRLVDADRALLDVARSRIPPDQSVAFRRLDLAADLEEALAGPLDLVTGSALVDLCSEAWLARLLDAMPGGAALYMALSYDGQEVWWPPHGEEPRALAAFHAHMRADKGLGPALGPDGAGTLARMLSERGWQVRVAASPWELGPHDAALIAALADGAAAAVSETGAFDPASLGDWHVARRRARRVSIGHVDLLALPPPGS